MINDGPPAVKSLLQAGTHHVSSDVLKPSGVAVNDRNDNQGRTSQDGEKTETKESLTGSAYLTNREIETSDRTAEDMYDSNDD